MIDSNARRVPLSDPRAGTDATVVAAMASHREARDGGRASIPPRWTAADRPPYKALALGFVVACAVLAIGYFAGWDLP
jgi:hypothetical protein